MDWAMPRPQYETPRPKCYEILAENRLLLIGV
jgi:hypothetical protein